MAPASGVIAANTDEDGSNPPGEPGAEFPLDSQGTADAVRRACEDDHVAVAHGLHDVAAVDADLTLDERVVPVQQFHPPGVTEPVVQLGRAFDVREHQRDGAVRRGVEGEVRAVSLDGVSDLEDGGPHVVGADALEFDLLADNALEVETSAEVTVDRSRSIQEAEGIRDAATDGRHLRQPFEVSSFFDGEPVTGRPIKTGAEARLRGLHVSKAETERAGDGIRAANGGRVPAEHYEKLQLFVDGRRGRVIGES